MKKVSALVFVASLVLSALGCLETQSRCTSADDPRCKPVEACEPGEHRLCDDAASAQFCEVDKEWGPCLEAGPNTFAFGTWRGCNCADGSPGNQQNVDGYSFGECIRSDYPKQPCGYSTDYPCTPGRSQDCYSLDSNGQEHIDGMLYCQNDGIISPCLYPTE